MRPTSRRTRPASPAETLSRRIQNHKAHIGVIGLGYVGLPLAVEFAKAGFHVTGIDLDGRTASGSSSARPLLHPGRAAAATSASSCAPAASPPRPTSTALRRGRHGEHLRPDAAARRRATPTSPTSWPPSTRSRSTCTPGQLVILESTTYPGTTDELILPDARAHRAQGRQGLLPRLLARARRPGQPASTRRSNIPKVVGGVTPALHRGRGRRSTAQPLETRRAGLLDAGRRDGEAAREHLPQRQHRPRQRARADVRARWSIDVWEVIEAAATKPFGFMPFYPGPGLGGHCIPIDPVLPLVEGAGSRLRGALHRAGRPGQRPACPSTSCDLVGEALNARSQAGQRLARPRARRRLQGATSTTCARARRSTS